MDTLRSWKGHGPILLGAALLIAGVASGCAARQVGAGAAQVVDVNERDFAIVASPRQLSPGDVEFRADNHGPDAHELIVVRAPAGDLPLRSDGLTVNEEGLKSAIVGALEPGESGAVRTLRVHLAKGRYVLFCNMAGHYMAGMETVVTVR